MTPLLLSLALAAGSLSNFPRPAGGPVAWTAASATLEGKPAVLLVAGEEVVALRAGGGTPRGFPLALGAGQKASGPPAAADMDRDGTPEIAVATEGGKLWLWSGGKPVPGFPVSLGAGCRAGPSFADVDADGRPEVVVGDDKGRLHAFGKGGKEPRGWPVALDSPVTSTASSSRFGGGHSLAVGLANGAVHVLALPGGKERPGFPLVTAFQVTAPPAFADFDGDGQMELVVASQDFQVHVVTGQGRPFAGFPAEAGYRIYDGPAIGDLDGDGRLDLAFASADGFLHAVSADGRKLPGFPVRVGSRLFGGPAIGDLDGDGKLEVVAIAADGNVVAVAGDGRMLPGFPHRLDAGDVTASPLLVDLESDRSLSAVIGLPSGEVHALRATRAGSGAAAPWPVPGHDPARTGRYGPNPPRFTALALAPLLPRTGDGLSASWRWASPDALPGDPEPAPAVEWYRDGAPVAQWRGKKEVPPRTVVKGELWRFAIVPPGGGAPLKSPEVQVGGAPPPAPAIALEPAQPQRGQPVRAVVTRQARDPDGDPVSYRYEWLLDGLPTGIPDPVFPGRLLQRGGVLGLRVVAFDSDGDSEPASAEGRVGNAPPGLATVAPVSPTVRRGDPVSVRIEAGAPDPDGDPLTYHFRWIVDGEARNYASNLATLTGAGLKKGQKIVAEVRAYDGELEGPPARAEFAVADSPPSAPQVELRPAKPRRGEPIQAVVASPGVDPDGDPVTYRFAWTRNGSPVAAPGQGRELPGSEVRRGDRFEVEAWASDGELESSRVKAWVEAVNTPPTAPVIAVRPARARGGEPLQMVVLQPSRDADGDRVTHEIAWTREGRALPEKGENLPAAQVLENSRIRVTVTPRDDVGPGTPARAEVITLGAPETRASAGNTPPARPEIDLEPREPTAGSGLRVRIRTASTDRDGDPVSYRYAWTRDGTLANVTGAEVAKGQIRHGETWAVSVRAFDGQDVSEAAEAGATVRNTLPPAPSVSISSEGGPVTGEPLRCEAAAPERDADGERVTLRYRWIRGGEAASVVDRPELPAGIVRRGERWRCEAVGWDGTGEGPPGRAEVTVKNSPPDAPRVVIEPETARRAEPLACRIAADATDPDGDKLRYSYAWWVNDQEVRAGADPTRIEARLLKKGQTWRCQVTASDGTAAGPAGRAERVVPNTAPGPARARLSPAAPRAGEPLRCEIQEPSVDPDGDVVRYTYAWTRNGQQQGFAPTADEVPGRLLRTGDRWRCLATPSDGDLSGPPAPTLEAAVVPGKEE